MLKHDNWQTISDLSALLLDSEHVQLESVLSDHLMLLDGISRRYVFHEVSLGAALQRLTGNNLLDTLEGRKEIARERNLGCSRLHGQADQKNLQQW